MPLELARATAATFLPYVGGAFRMGDPDAVELRLTDVKVTGAGPRPFSLLFLSPGAVALPQATYRLEHDVLGSMEIFLVPVGKDAAGVLYEAVFN